MGVELREATFHALGDGPGSHGGSADSFDPFFGIVDANDLVNGLSVVEFEVVFVVEDTFVVFLVIVTFAKAEADDGVACGIEDDEGVGGTLVAVEVFE